MLTNTINAFPNTNSTWFHVPYEGPDQIFIEIGQGLTIRSSGSTSFLSPLDLIEVLCYIIYFMFPL